MEVSTSTILTNGVNMPTIGYGVYQIDPAEAERCVLDALETGYRMVDTAQGYHNEEGVGAAVAKSGLKREEVFLVSKIWISNYGEERAAASIDESLRKLRTDYIDLMLLHQPFCDRYGAYRALEAALKSGKVRAIGVSNFFADHFIDLASNVEIPPMVNQMETHAFNQQKTLRKYLDEFNCKLMSWGPLAEGRNGFFTNPVLESVGQAHGKSVAQVGLRFLLQSDVIIIPKSVHKERMAQNLDILDFALTDEEMERVRAMDEAKSLFFDHHEGETTKMFMGLRSLV
ncbi:MAG: aldo/keto reductase [Thermoguttaceae bacterium]|nr:aldo/keto reductase [Thermoguttaceae bacterium]